LFGKARNIPGTNPLPLTFNGYACDERVFTKNEIASCIDVMTKNNYDLLFYNHV